MEDGEVGLKNKNKVIDKKLARLKGFEPVTYRSGVRRTMILKSREKHDFQGQKPHYHLVNLIHN